jgi:hypothetical protein
VDVVLAGVGDLFEEVEAALAAEGATVRGIRDPTDADILAALEERIPAVVVIVARSDAVPLRLALLVRHLDEDVPLVVTVFDRDMAEQLEQAVPHLTVVSVADIAAPALAEPCLEALGEADRPQSRAAALAAAVLQPYDRSAALVFYGAIGLAAILVFETIGGLAVLDQGFPDAFYGATKSLATVDPNSEVQKGPSWFKVAISASMLLTLLFAAAFTGGLLNRIVDHNLTGLAGPRAVPRRGHVVVIGLGQVGLRLCLLLRERGVPVVAVDTEAEGENVGLARRLKLPVVIGRGANPALLRRLSLRRAVALAAVTSDDLVNLEAAMTARSVDRELRVVLRAGSGEVADETRSLLRIGHVIDVHRVAAERIAEVALETAD